ncbi:MAG: type II toxin-antitoxin system HicB family antitoxin [Chloroflexota bacterium]
MKKEFTVVIEKDEDGYFVGMVPALKGCHTQAKSLDELMKRMKEAVLLCLEVEGETTEGELNFVGVQRIAV